MNGGDPSLLFDGMWEDPNHFVESLPLNYDNDKRFDDIRLLVAKIVINLRGGRVDLVEKLLNCEYTEINEFVCDGGTLLGFVNSIEMAEVLIKHGATFKGRGFDCFKEYVSSPPRLHILNHFFTHPEFIFRNVYGEYANYVDNNKSIVELLKRKRDRQRAVITMSALADRYRTDIYVHLTSLVESFL